MSEAYERYAAALAKKRESDAVWHRRLEELRSDAASTCVHPAEAVYEHRTGDEGYASDVIHEHQTCRVCKATREVYPRRTEWHR